RVELLERHRSPRSTSSRPIDAAAIPFPSEETTPPGTKMYLVGADVASVIESHPGAVEVPFPYLLSLPAVSSPPAPHRRAYRFPLPPGPPNRHRCVFRRLAGGAAPDAPDAPARLPGDPPIAAALHPYMRKHPRDGGSRRQQNPRSLGTHSADG